MTLAMIDSHNYVKIIGVEFICALKTRFQMSFQLKLEYLSYTLVRPVCFLFAILIGTSYRFSVASCS
jgi:hypothetical protein